MLNEAETEWPLCAVICNSLSSCSPWLCLDCLLFWLGLSFFLYITASIDRPCSKLFVCSISFKAKKYVCLSILGTGTSGACNVFHNLEIRHWNCLDSPCSTYTKLFKLF